MMARSTDEVIARACSSKRAYGEKTARAVAERMRGQGEKISPYRCPFCHWWHIGHVPSVEHLAEIMLAVRDQAGNRPGPHRSSRGA